MFHRMRERKILSQDAQKIFGYSVTSALDEGIEDAQGRTDARDENYADVLMTGHYGGVG